MKYKEIFTKLIFTFNQIICQNTQKKFVTNISGDTRIKS